MNLFHSFHQAMVRDPTPNLDKIIIIKIEKPTKDIQAQTPRAGNVAGGESG